MRLSTAREHWSPGPDGAPLPPATPVLRASTGRRATTARSGARRGLVLAAAVLLLRIVSVGPAAAATSTAWQWPLDPTPVVLRGFVAPTDPYGPGSRGVELAAAVGQPVLAASSGTVAFAGLVAGAPVVTVRHALIVTTYEPVLAVVGVGQAVAAGERLGTVAALPRLCGTPTCLHWGAYLPASAPRRYVDPLALIGAGPVRLLPDTAAQPAAPPRPAEPLRPATPLRPADRLQPLGGSAARVDGGPARREPLTPAATTSGGRTGTAPSHGTTGRVIAVATVAMVATPVGGAAVLALTVPGAAGARIGRRSRRRAPDPGRLR